MKPDELLDKADRQLKYIEAYLSHNHISTVLSEGKNNSPRSGRIESRILFDDGQVLELDTYPITLNEGDTLNLTFTVRFR